MTDPAVWLDGRLVTPQAAGIDPRCRGLLFGMGIYETLAVRRGVPVALHPHLDRLAAGAAVLHLDVPPQAVLTDAITAVCRACGLAEARVRITLAAGPEGSSPAAFCMITAVPLVPPKPSAAVITVPWRRNERSPLAGIKFTACPDNLLAQRAALAAGADEAVFFNTRDELCEGAFSNVFLVRSGTVITPPLSSGCLPGTTREIVLDHCRREPIPCEEGTVTEVLPADEIFLTTSIRGIQPVHQFDGTSLPAPGPMTRRLQEICAPALGMELTR